MASQPKVWAVWCRDHQQIVDRANFPGAALVTALPDDPSGWWVYLSGDDIALADFLLAGAKSQPRWTITQPQETT